MTDTLISSKINNYLETVNTIFAKLGQKEVKKYFDVEIRGVLVESRDAAL